MVKKRIKAATGRIILNNKDISNKAVALMLIVVIIATIISVGIYLSLFLHSGGSADLSFFKSAQKELYQSSSQPVEIGGKVGVMIINPPNKADTSINSK